MDLCLGVPRQRLGGAELDKELAPLLGSRRLVQGAAQVHGGDRRRRPCEGVPRRVAEHPDGPLVAGTGGEEEVGGRLFWRQVILVEQPGGATMGLPSLDRRYLQVHRVANERVQKGERGARSG